MIRDNSRLVSQWEWMYKEGNEIGMTCCDNLVVKEVRKMTKYRWVMRDIKRTDERYWRVHLLRQSWGEVVPKGTAWPKWKHEGMHTHSNVEKGREQNCLLAGVECLSQEHENWSQFVHFIGDVTNFWALRIWGFKESHKSSIKRCRKSELDERSLLTLFRESFAKKRLPGKQH